jgi:hypothetical protein
MSIEKPVSAHAVYSSLLLWTGLVGPKRDWGHSFWAEWGNVIPRRARPPPTRLIVNTCRASRVVMVLLLIEMHGPLDCSNAAIV